MSIKIVNFMKEVKRVDDFPRREGAGKEKERAREREQ
jgi:hypothetical protein